jgi:SAP domain-containing new25/Domain of unknown function (DUF6434)
MQRPELNAHLSANEFAHWYWLKEELLQFCRAERLPVTGSKPQLSERIAAHLAGQSAPTKQAPRRAGAMPTSFALDTVIGPGWRCGPALGAFMRVHCGNGFRFNAAVRNFIHTHSGQHLADAVACYQRSVARGAPVPQIIPQNEYNQHTRDFFAQNPGATRQQAIAAWQAKRALRKTPQKT